ncbi:hypothetical protein JCM19239_2534 [Vibrio variabilis]|nr:hypothetical protein JCM19239_2534 [Vibrio variabilis]
MIPLSFFFMAIAGCGLVLHSLNKLFNPHLMYAKSSDSKE